MRRLLLASLCTLAFACDAEDDTDFRDLEIGNGDLSIHEGEYADNADCRIWDIVGGDVYDGAAFLPDSRVVLSIIDSDDGQVFVGPDGDVRCSVDTSGALVRLRDANGVAQFSIWQKWALHGDFAVPPGDGGVAAAAVYTFQGDQVFDGISSGPLLISADKNLQLADPERKALLTALLDGTCF